jgi:hypothetical protein
VLLREVLRQRCSALDEQRGLRAADLAVHQHQRLAFAVEAAVEVVVHHVLAEVGHHRAVGAPAEGLVQLQPVAVQRPQLDDAQPVQRGQAAPRTRRR